MHLYDTLVIQLEKLRVPVSSQAYTFDFGPQELINLIGLPKDEGNVLIRKLFENTKIKVVNNKIHLTKTEEVDKQAKYYRKMERIEKSRKKGSLSNL